MPCHCSPLTLPTRSLCSPSGELGGVGRVSHLAGQGLKEKNLDSTGAWGQHAEGPAWSRAGQAHLKLWTYGDRSMPFPI